MDKGFLLGILLSFVVFFLVTKLNRSDYTAVMVAIWRQANGYTLPDWSNITNPASIQTVQTQYQNAATDIQNKMVTALSDSNKTPDEIVSIANYWIDVANSLSLNFAQWCVIYGFFVVTNYKGYPISSDGSCGQGSNGTTYACAGRAACGTGMKCSGGASFCGTFWCGGQVGQQSAWWPGFTELDGVSA